MRVSAILSLICGVLFFALCVWAWRAGDFSEEIKVLAQSPWLVVITADLYLGFVILSALIHFLERSVPITITLFLLMCVLGNLVGVAYLVFLYKRRQRTTS